MQPTLALSAIHPGTIHINGSFAGEVSANQVLLRPVARQGALYLDYRPLTDAGASLTRKLVFSGGEPMAESVEAASGLDVVIWPGGTVEIELAPGTRSKPGIYTQPEGHRFYLDDENRQLYCDNRPICTLPDGAAMPEYRRVSGGAVLCGDCAAGRYMLAFDDEFRRQTGFLQAQQLDIESDGRIRAIVSAGDLVGHASLESWRLTPEGLMMLSSESAWAYGAPRWPETAAETARAAMDAMLAGLNGEAEGYLSPALRSKISLEALRNQCDLCVEMKYAPPDGRPCVGLMQLEGDHLARVKPLYYRASPAGGPQGPWVLDALELA